MSDAVNVHSFDHARERPAPASARVVRPDGTVGEVRFEAATLVVAVKPSCEGCRDFVAGDLADLGAVDVLVVSAAPDAAGEWASSPRPVLVAPELLEALDVRWPPYYVLIVPEGPRVVAEGAVFSAAQVAQEIARHLA